MTDQMKLIAEKVSNWFEKEFSEGRLSFKSKDWGEGQKILQILDRKIFVTFLEKEVKNRVLF